MWPVSMYVARAPPVRDRKSTRLNSSHITNSYAVCCLKKKNHFLEDVLEEALHGAVDVLLLDEAHLEVDLPMVRLAVGAAALVADAARPLAAALASCDQ